MARLIRLLLQFLRNPFKFYRVSILRQIHTRSAVLKRLRKNNLLEKEFISKLSRYKTKWDQNKKGIVLAQSVFNFEMCIKIAAISNKLAKDKNSNIALYSAECFIKPKTFIVRFLSSSKFKTNLDKIFLSFAGKVLYRNNDLYLDKDKIYKIFNEIKQQIKTKSDVLNIYVEDVKIGDLVYDTYLRFANKPQMDISDPFFEKLLIETLNIFFISKQKIQENNIVALVNSYTTYTYHGIMARLCLQNNIPVYTTGSYSLLHKVLKEYPSHANNHFNFKKLFKKLENREEIIRTHKGLFEKRFEGVIDNATYYMKQSAFSNEINKELDGINWQNTVVILAHCFFDSPHVYRDLLFPDFYDWINYTLQALIKQTNITIIVKQHPNGALQNDDVFEHLKSIEAYKNVKFIDKKTSQLQIINSQPKAIITAYGTAAAEFAYQGFPVITIYDNPFTAYNFTHNANSIEEYKELLSKIMTLQTKQNKDDIIEYYYMQYFFFLQGRNADYLKCLKYLGQTSSDEFLSDYLPNMTDEYFAKLDEAIQDGLDLCKWEEENS